MVSPPSRNLRYPLVRLQRRRYYRRMFFAWRSAGAVALVTLLTSLGCGGSVGTAGALYVRVTGEDMTNVADARVTTDPETQSLTTDALGTVIFATVPTGFYTVTASHPALGSGRTAVKVTAGELTDVTIALQAGQSIDAGMDAPRVDGAATDARLDASDARVDAPPAGDGGMDAPPADAGPSGSIVLAALSKDSNGIDLAWSISAGNAFSSYRVYRAKDTGSFEIINILNAPATLTHRDESPTLGGSYRYRIGGVPATGAEVFSNEQTIVAGVYISVNSQVERLKADPTRPYLYALDRVNNSLHFVNLTTNAVEKSIFIGSSPADLAINLAGTELFVANYGSTEIAVVNLNTREKARSLLVDTSRGTWDGNPYRLVCTAGDMLVFTSLDQWNDLKLVSAANGAHIIATGSLYSPQLATSPDGTRVYASGGTSSGVTRYDVSATALTQVDTSTSSGSTITATKNGMYVFGGNVKILANNLKSVLGTFSESILLANADGSIAVGPSKVHNGTTFSVIKSLPLTTSIMALGSDDRTVYLYDTMSSRIYIYKLPQP